MVEANGKHIIHSLEKKWRVNVILSYLFVSLAIAIVLAVLLHKLVLLTLLCAIPLFVLIFVTIVFLQQKWKINEQDVSVFLNRHYPQLQESAHLVLAPYEKLNFLQKLQTQKVERELSEIAVPKQFNQKLISSLLTLLIAGIISFVLLKLPISQMNGFSKGSSVISVTDHSTTPAEKILPEIKSVSVQIVPPAYTKKSRREQDKFNLLVEEGGDIMWQLKTNVSVKKLALIFNDKQVLSLQPLNAEHTNWSGRRSFTHPGFYQVAIDNKLSEFYKIEMIKDLPPVINIQAPKPNLIIDFGSPRKVMLSVGLSDDYGVNDASVSATISSGSGEAVKFKEQQLTFSDFAKGNVKYNLKKLLDLDALGMKPGDELYFYVKAVDNHNQEKRSDVYIISLADTAQLMSMDGLVTGIDLKPEYFRSERQIIIESEQLIKDRDTISVQEFNNRSNNLGIDQKLLRLRYGKFLGEENETEIPGGHEHNEAGHNDAADFGNAEKVIDEYSHKHDNAEDASFFEPTLKAQLKATLNEMWKAELQLRLNKPQNALPFEYKALKLLKDLQQKSRVYVAKTGFKSTPLKPEKRLTGDLSKIAQPTEQQQVEKKKDVYEVSRKAAGLLGLLKTGRQINPEAIGTLQQASLQLYSKAAEQPSLYLPAVTSMNRILAAISKHSQPKMSDINTTENGLQKMLSAVVKLPGAMQGAASESLSDEYFKNINRGRH